MRSRTLPIASALLLVSALPVHAAAPGVDPGEGGAQVAGLFVQACLQHPGAVASLRNWAAQHGLKALPPQGADAFLHGVHGLAYDATTPGGRFVLVSEDGGSCSAVAQHADPAALDAALAADLGKVGATITLVAERDDSEERALHLRTYRLNLDGRAYALVSGTTAGGGQAMLTLTAP
jgi:hypothetical protein